MMYGYGYGPAVAGGSVIGMLFMMFFGLLVVVGIILVIVWAVRRGGAMHEPMHGMPGQMHAPMGQMPMAPPTDNAMAVLRERLAKGEISNEEYEKIAKTLSGQ